MNYKLRVLSPLHIGCGEKYSGLNYVIHNGKMFCIDPDDFISALGEDKTRAFVGWIETCSSKLDSLETRKNTLRRNRDEASKKEVSRINSDLRQQRQAFTLKKFIENNEINLEQIINKALYYAKALQGVFEDSEINPFIKQMNQPYIPGTEIKGAIRTAVLYCALIDQKNSNEGFIKLIKNFGTRYKDEIDLVKNQNDLKKKNPKNNRESYRDIKNKLEDKMSDISKEIQNEILNTKAKDAKYDVMKFIQVGDSGMLNPGKCLAVSYVKPYNISINPHIFYEYINPETEIGLSSLTLESKISLKTKLDNMGFDDKQKKIVSGIDTILNYCHRFSNDLIAEEISFFQAKRKPHIVDQLKKIAALNTAESPVLRIGKDEGYNSLTVGLAIKKLDPNLYENVLIHATKNKSYDSAHGGPMPKSRKIVYWNGEETTSGWVQLIPENSPEFQANFKNNSRNQAAQEREPASATDLSKLQGVFNVKVKRT